MGEPRSTGWVTDEGGDPVCWLHRLCPECGAVPSPDAPGRCWRCGARLPDLADDHGDGREHTDPLG